MTGLPYGTPRFRLCVEPSMTIVGAASLSSWIAARPGVRVPVAIGWFVAACGSALVFAGVVG
jgi:hypothetical protein